MKRKLRRFQQSFVLSHKIYFIASVFSWRGVYSSIIPPQGGGKESKALRAREENQRVKKKGREGEREEEKEKGKGGKKKIRVQMQMKEEKICGEKGNEKKWTRVPMQKN